jgi:hypothetical protein
MKFDIENTFPDVVAGELLEFWANKADENNTATSFEYDMFIAKTIAETVRDNIPMYTGNLNHKWKFWDDVCKELAEIDKIGDNPTHG